MTRRKSITKNNFETAIKDSAGVIETIAKKIGVSRIAVYYWVKKNSKFAEPLILSEREKLIDIAESKMIGRVKEDDWVAVNKVLSSVRARGRGWTERSEVSNEVQISDFLSVEKKEEIIKNLLNESKPKTVSKDNKKGKR